MSAEAIETTQRRLAFAAALIFLISGLTGGYAGLAMTGKIPGVDGKAALVAHMNALLSTFWLLGLAWSLRFCALGATGLRALVGLTLLATYGNWAVTVLKSVLAVKGLAFTTGEPDSAANNLVFILLSVVVVGPTLAAAALWSWGLRPGAARLPAA